MPDTKLKDFIALFRGFRRKNVIGDILHELNASNHDSSNEGVVQFVPHYAMHANLTLDKSLGYAVTIENFVHASSHIAQRTQKKGEMFC